MNRRLVVAVGCLLAVGLAQSLLGEPAVPEASIGHAAASIPLDQIGAMAGKQYSGDGLNVAPSPDGAMLRCAPQKLNARITTEGLALVSTADGAKGEPVRVIARALVREDEEALAVSGKVAVTGQMARFNRAGLTEEYTVSVDGVRQDFVISHRPEGTGPVRLELEVNGAKAEAMGDGARLVLSDGERKLVYHQLKAEDARGKEVKARMEVLSGGRLAVVLEDADAVYPVRIDPTFSDANWAIMNPGVPGANGGVVAAVMDSSGNLYIGGLFSVVGGVVANNIAKWDGTHWSALGSGMDNSVHALAVSGSTVYAGGYFNMAGGVAATNIAKWDGSSWSSLGSGMGGACPFKCPHVTALAVLGSSVYAGGLFMTAGGIAATNIAKWDGSTWSALGEGINGPSPDVSALAVLGSDLYAGGLFKTAGGTAASNIAKWDGNSWSALGLGINIGVSALAASGTDLYVAGAFTTAGGIAANDIAKWDGNSWSALGSGLGGVDVYALAVSGANLYAGGHFTTAGGSAANYIAKWDGSGWSALSSGTGGEVNALAASGNNVYAGGSFMTAGGGAANNIARWDGNSWAPLASGSGMNREVLALVILGTDLYAGGRFTTAGGSATNYIGKWDGTSWSGLGSGLGNEVLALAVSGTNLYAGGSFPTAGGSPAKNIAKWDGSNWSALGKGVNGQVDALAVSGTDLYASGNFTTAGGNPATNIAKWDGNSWTPLSSGLGGGIPGTSLGVYALAVSGPNLYAGGNFTIAGGSLATNVAKWDGSSWTALGSGSGMGGAFPNVIALAVLGSDLYAGGVFTSADGTPANYIAKWDGSKWTSVGSGLNSTVYSLAVSGTTLYAGGHFTMAGTSTSAANRIAKWDGSHWAPLGSGMDSTVDALAVSDSDLYAGGYFGTAGGKVSPYIARASLLTLPTTPPTPSVLFSGVNVVLTWPTTTTGVTLQSTTNLSPPVVWTTNSPAPIIAKGQNTVTDPILGAQKFYRLSQ